jgi:hypothetical protein
LITAENNCFKKNKFKLNKFSRAPTRPGQKNFKFENFLVFETPHAWFFFQLHLSSFSRVIIGQDAKNKFSRATTRLRKKIASLILFQVENCRRTLRQA